MKYLLDTHTLLWVSIGSNRLSKTARALLTGTQHIFFVSAVTSFELSTKHRLGRLPEAKSLLVNFEMQIEQSGFQLLSISSLHARSAGAYPQIHKDPFDRVLAAQALVEELWIMSADEQLDVFDVQRVW